MFLFSLAQHPIFLILIEKKINFNFFLNVITRKKIRNYPLEQTVWNFNFFHDLLILDIINYLILLKLEEDVKKESLRIKSSDLQERALEEPLIVNDLFKSFRKDGYAAVNNLSFGVLPNECFG